MNLENKRKKTNYKFRRFIGIILLILIIFFVYKSIRGKTYTNHKTAFPTFTLYKDEVDAKSYNILKEKVYYSNADGIALYNASEGQKVPVIYDIVVINLMNDVSSLKDELIKVNSALNYKLNKKPTEKISEEEIESIKKIQKDIRDENLLQAIEDINNLDLNTKQSISISELTELMNLSVEELNSKKQELLKQISRSNIYYQAEYSGIVSYKIDGLEKYYKPDDLSIYTRDYLREHSRRIENETKTQVEKGDMLFKLIDNFSYNMALSIEDLSSLGDIKIGDKLNVELSENNIIRGNVAKINKSKDKSGVVILYLDEMIDKLYSERIRNVKIVKNKQKCYKIPKSAIIKRKGIFGVYVQEIHGLVKFVPIDVIQPLNSSSYVSSGDKNGVIKISDKEYKTITINDSIVLNPKTVDDSQILN